MAAPNLAATVTVTAKTVRIAVTSSNQTLVNNAASSGKAIKVVSIYIANVDGSAADSVTVTHHDQDDVGGTGRELAKTIEVAANSTFVAVDANAPVWLEEDTSIGVVGVAASGDLVAVTSYLEYED